MLSQAYFFFQAALALVTLEVEATCLSLNIDTDPADTQNNPTQFKKIKKDINTDSHN